MGISVANDTPSVIAPGSRAPVIGTNPFSYAIPAGRHPPILPIYSMVDRRRALHREAIAARPDWPVIPILSTIEQMATERAPVGAFASKSPAADAFARLWRGVEKRIAKG